MEVSRGQKVYKGADKRAYISLGGNLGNREASLLAAIAKVGELSTSPPLLSNFYESEPWGFTHEVPHFLNVVMAISSTLAPHKLLQELLKIERELGRERNTPTKEGEAPLQNKTTSQKEYSSRTIDIDLLLYGKEVIESQFLTLPHPHIAERAFVLVPLNEIAPNLTHPSTGKSIEELLKECSCKLQLHPYPIDETALLRSLKS